MNREKVERDLKDNPKGIFVVVLNNDDVFAGHCNLGQTRVYLRAPNCKERVFPIEEVKDVRLTTEEELLGLLGEAYGILDEISECLDKAKL